MLGKQPVQTTKSTLKSSECEVVVQCDARRSGQTVHLCTSSYDSAVHHADAHRREVAEYLSSPVGSAISFPCWEVMEVQ